MLTYGFTSSSFRESRLLHFSVPLSPGQQARVDALDAFSKKEAPKKSLDGRLAELPTRKDAVTASILKAYRDKADALKAGRSTWYKWVSTNYLNRSKDENAANREKYEKDEATKAMLAEAEKAATAEVDAAASGAGDQLGNFENAAMNAVAKAGLVTDRKLLISTAKEKLAEKAVKDLQKEIDFFKLEQQSTKALADKLKMPVTLDELKELTDLQGVAQAALKVAKEEKAAVQKDKLPKEATDTVTIIAADLDKIPADYNQAALYDLDEGMYEAINGDPKKLNAILDNPATKIPSGKKNLIKAAVASLSSPALQKAAAVLFRERIGQRVTTTEAINTKVSTADRVKELATAAKPGQKVRLPINGINTDFAFADGNFDNAGKKYIMLVGASGAVASIDLTPDPTDNKLYVTYQESSGADPESVALPDTVAVPVDSDDKSYVYLTAPTAP